MKQKIIAEANFLQDILYQLYVGGEEFDIVSWNIVRKRLQAIIDEARKEDGEE